ncbi:MAG: glutamate mutase L [Anaerolinea sp.]|nr:glutamate mutase L [Anaerolinea sp.]MCC6975987.1 glutamate mutase L [Anaerolineae bacterium]
MKGANVVKTATGSARSGTLGAILAADIGGVHTRAVLLDLVEGQYRLISRAQALTTAAPPVGDVAVGLRHALDKMTLQTGRYFMDNQNNILLRGTQDGSGANAFFATASAGRPMRVTLAGLMPDMSLAAARRALNSTYIELTDVLSLNDTRTPEAQLNTLLRNQPDVIFVVGGTNEGATAPIRELLKTIRFGVLLSLDPKPAVLYAGNEALHAEVADMLRADTRLYIAPNVRPNLRSDSLEAVELELALLYGEWRAASVGGFEEVKSLSDMGVLPTAQAAANIVRYLGELPENPTGALLIDVGSGITSVTAGFKGDVSTTLRADLGLGISAVLATQAVGAPTITRWLSFAASDTEIIDYAWNKTFRPTTIPAVQRDLELEGALLREIVKMAVSGARHAWNGRAVPNRIIAAGGGLAVEHNPALGALLLLDGLQPTGVITIHLDPFGLIPALGAVAYLDSAAAIQTLDSGILPSITALCPDGRASGSVAMEVTIKYAGGREIGRSVPAGSLRLIPIPAGQKARVTVKLSRGLSLGGKRRVTIDVENGTTALLCDGRGRPISLSRDVNRRAANLQKWYAAIRGQEGGA